MKRIARKLAVRAANRDITVGVATGVVLTGYRLVALTAFVAVPRGPLSLWGVALMIECLLLLACTVGVYRRSEAAAISLAGLYGLRVAFLWYASGHAVPPFSLISLLLAYGLYRGIRGTGELDALPAPISLPLANER